MSAIDKPNLPRLREQYISTLGSLDNTVGWEGPFLDFLGALPENIPPSYSQRLVRGWSARITEACYEYASLRGDAAGAFYSTIRERLTTLPLPIYLRHTDEQIGGKRLPAFTESLEATSERHAAIEQFPTIFSTVFDAIAVGGSMRYGPYYNVRKRLSSDAFSSDVDVLAVRRPGGEFSKESLTGIFTGRSIETFYKRSSIFDRLHQRGKADIFSHRFHMVENDFNVSIQMFPPTVFANLFHLDLAADLRGDKPLWRSLRVYKPEPFRHSECNRQGFDGSIRIYKVEQQQTDGGYITRLPAYGMEEGRFYPGFWHDMIPPNTPVRTDTPVLTAIVKAYNSLMRQRLDQERVSDPHASITKASIRNALFAPQRYNIYGERM